MMLDRPLTDLLPISWVGQPGTVASLLGQPWAHAYRALHPAADRSGRSISWGALAASRDRTVDLAVAGWHDVSGSRLHHPADTAEFAAEPAVGPDPDVVPAVISALGKRAATSEAFVAEWDGYGRSDAATRLSPAAVYEGRVIVGRTVYHAWRASLSAIGDLAAEADLGAEPSATNLIADLVWDPACTWLAASSVDLASSYIGSRLAMDSHWPGSLEIVPVNLAMPLG